MAAPLIGITTYGQDDRGRYELPSEYVQSVRRAGGLPLLMPPGEPRLDQWLELVDALVLTGGGDLAPADDRDAHEAVYNVDPVRDTSEKAVARHALAHQPPTLCICRGMQVLNAVLGGSLHTHLPDVYGEQVAHRMPPREPVPHDVSVDAHCRLAALMGSHQLATVSWHHQAIDRLGAGLRVVARAPDDVIEAVELEGHPWLLAVQWHPELSAATDPTQQRLFDALVAEAARRAEEGAAR
jgi:putative glutamine amidotransferase